MAKQKEKKPELPKLKFKADQKSPTLEIGHGEYRRKFDAKEQPFEVESEEELRFLKGTGYFVEVKEDQKAAPKKATAKSEKPKAKSSETPANAEVASPPPATN